MCETHMSNKTETAWILHVWAVDIARECRNNVTTVTDDTVKSLNYLDMLKKPITKEKRNRVTWWREVCCPCTQHRAYISPTSDPRPCSPLLSVLGMPCLHITCRYVPYTDGLININDSAAAIQLLPGQNFLSLPIVKWLSSTKVDRGLASSVNSPWGQAPALTNLVPFDFVEMQFMPLKWK